MADKLSSAPKDSFNIAYLLYFLLGTSYLLTWNTFISAKDYFILLYPWGHVNRVFTVAFAFASLTAVTFMTFLGLRVPSVWRVNTGLVICLATLVFVPIMNSIFVSNGEGSVVTYVITVVAVALCGVGHVVMYGSLVASASRNLPRRYLRALATGIGASGLISNILRIITKAVMPQTESGTVASAYLYFTVCVLMMVVSIISYNLEDKLPVICYYKHLNGSGLESVCLLSDGVDNEKVDVLPLNSDGFGSVDQGRHGNRNGYKLEFYKRVWSHMQGYALSLGFTYLVTISIFPGYITEDLTSSYFGDWYAILLLLCKNSFDFIGRILPNFPIFMTEKKAFVIGGAVARIVFYLLYYLCDRGPAFFQTEAFEMVTTCIFGFTFGYLTCVLLMLGPKSVPVDEAEVAGSLMVTFQQVGDVAGSILQWVWVL